MAVAVRAAVAVADEGGRTRSAWRSREAAWRALEGAATVLVELLERDPAGRTLDVVARRELDLWHAGGVSLDVIDAVAERLWPDEFQTAAGEVAL